LIRSLLCFVTCSVLYLSIVFAQQSTPSPAPAFTPPVQIFGFRDAAPELQLEKSFMAVPDPALAKQHLQTLTAAPHVAGSPEDRRTAEYVLDRYKAAGLDAMIQPYKVWMGLPLDVRVDLVAPAGVTMHGPSPEHVEDDPFQKDPRILPAFNEYSASGDVTADVVYANYGRAEDFRKLKEMGIDVKGKIVICRYGDVFRGVKAAIASEYGAAGVIIYSDPIDDGYFKGDKYPQGPWRPDSAVQRGSVQYVFKYPGDPTTPDVASVPDLAAEKRISPERADNLPRIPVTPLSYGDASPILANLGGQESPRAWQGALPFTYHVGPGPAKVHMVVKIAYQYTTIWDVVGTIKGSEFPNESVVLGNHRDAWVYGAVDPNSGTAAQLEAVHGLGQLLKAGWRPKRTIIFASWDGEEEGLLGSTEYAEQHAKAELSRAVTYINMDAAVSGAEFGASAVPSLKQFVRDVTKAVPSPKGGSVYDQWRAAEKGAERGSSGQPEMPASGAREPATAAKQDVKVGEMGSGSDFTPFLQHLGVPAADINSHGSYGVYHSAFDDFAWFTKFGDPTFVYEQEMARVYGLMAMRLASADQLPLDYEAYGKEVGEYLKIAERRSKAAFGEQAPSFAEAESAATRLQTAGADMLKRQSAAAGDNGAINLVLRNAERAFIASEGLPGRPWYKHLIYAPGQQTGYAALVIPGVNESIENKNLAQTTQQLKLLTTALNRAAGMLEMGK
jgi:N-acetylated-alpha-linked acidic dipeptidase